MGTPEGITWALLLTAVGAGIAGAAVSAFVEVLKNSVLPNANGAVVAFITTAVLYVLAVLFTYSGPDAILVGFLSWLTAALAAVGTHSTVIRPALARRAAPAPDAPPV